MKKQSEETLYAGKYISLKRQTLLDKNDREIHWEFAERNGLMRAAAVFAMTEKGEVVLVRQYRPPLNGFTIEMPAGLLDKPGEDPADTVVRELKEETGYETRGPVRFLLETHSSPGMTSEKVFIYHAQIGGGHPTEQDLDDSEDIHVYPPVSVARLDEFLAGEEQKGYLVDYKILAAWAKLKMDGTISGI